MAEAPAKKKAAPSSGGLMSKKVGGVPLPIIIVGGLVAAIVIYRKIKGSSSSTAATTATGADTSGTGTSGTDAGTSDGSGGGWSGGGGSTGAGGGGGSGRGQNSGFSSLLAQIATLQTEVGSLVNQGSQVSLPHTVPNPKGTDILKVTPKPVSAKPTLVTSGPSIFTAAQAAKTQTNAPVVANPKLGQAGVEPTVKQTTTGTTPAKPTTIAGAKTKVGTGVQGSGLKNSGL